MATPKDATKIPSSYFLPLFHTEHPLRVQRTKSSAEEASSRDLLLAYARLWGACGVADYFMLDYLHPSKITLVVCTVLSLMNVLKPSFPGLAVAVSIRLFVRLMKAPFMWDAEMWQVWLDLTLLVGMMRGGMGAIRNVQNVVTKQLAIFYFAAGFWKLNTSFLNPETSCASMFTASLLLQHMPWAPDFVIKVAIKTGPVVIILGECGIGLLLACPQNALRLMGVALALGLHTGIAITPFPFGIAVFSYLAATRYFFLLPESTAQALDEAMEIPFQRGTWTQVGVAVFLAGAYFVGRVTGYQQIAVVYFAALLLLYYRAFRIELARKQPTTFNHGLGNLGCLILVACVFVTLGQQILGLVDMTAPASPFSSIRLHGGSNHLLVPTGLLQAWGQNWTGSDFSGGVVRIEFTDSRTLNELYPANYTDSLSPKLVEVMRRHGHLGMVMNPTERRVMGPSHMQRWEAGMPFLRYTVPALELRRLLAEARATGEDFSMEYTHLQGSQGDERWRATAGGRRVRIIVNGSVTVCTIGGVPCAPDEIALMPEPGAWAKKTLIFFPLPILPDWTENNKDLPCLL